MRFIPLLARAGIKPRTVVGDADVKFVCSDSRKSALGGCFVAIKGCSCDGHDFIHQAIDAGISAVVVQNESRIPKHLRDKIAYAVIDDTQQGVGMLAQAILGFPARKLVCLGVTGTNGKSTVTHFIHSVLNNAGIKTGMLGTVSYDTVKRSIPATMTTPDPVALASMCDEMVSAGATHMIMEVSSHALDQKRISGIDFTVGIYTNLSGDHLDYHGTMEDYLASKCKLFEAILPRGTAVINRDDPYAEQIAAATEATVCTYGLNPLADLQGRIHRIDAEGTDFDMIIGEQVLPVHTTMIGRHNVFNALATAQAVCALGLEFPQIAELLGKIETVPGRLQRVQTDGTFQVFVDYAHTDDALRNVLGSLRPVCKGRLVVVFGCGGNRDKSKRPRMAQVAQEFADSIIVTSDNPRNELPQQIIDEILTGFSGGNVQVEPDRKSAISLAIQQALSDDIIVIAGKGHETYQVVNGQRTDFDDAEVAHRCITARGKTK
ncbi:MAG: UDP-N-acetylmuramoyl-L-alanyl-D-glutamate--2,6-diaminopimelate ligase [Phycisphaerae bacterium]|nr:UDP-N-acetylmuramoyl-L-alanyl-D-glutamate--2,6-diaminopimelate ligase [Phycisphaerae bacterium]